MKTPHRHKPSAAVRQNIAQTRRRARTGAPRVTVGPIGTMHDFWGRRISRPLAPQLLHKALTKHFQQPDNLLHHSLRTMLGNTFAPDRLKQVRIKLFQEGEFQYIFQVEVKLPGTPLIRLAMPVAKDGGRISHTAAIELQNLRELYTRDARYVVRQFAGGPISLPVAGNAAKERTVFAYFTTWLDGLHELGVDERLNYFINAIPFHTFNHKAGDRIRATILKILFSLYDPQRQRAMVPPQIASGDFVISRPRPNEPYVLKLIACRRMLSGVTLAKCLRLYLGYHGVWADKNFHLLPRDPRLLAEALQQGLVQQNPGVFSWKQILDALREYVTELKDSSTCGVASDWTPLARLREVVRSA